MQNILHRPDVLIVSENDPLFHRSHPDPLSSELVPDVESVDQTPGGGHKCDYFSDSNEVGYKAQIAELDEVAGAVTDSGVVPDVKPVDQPLEGKNALETAFATGFLNGGVLGGHFVQQVEADGFRNPKYDVTQLLDEGVTGHPFVHEFGTDRIPVLGFCDRDNMV